MSRIKGIGDLGIREFLILSIPKSLNPQSLTMKHLFFPLLLPILILLITLSSKTASSKYDYILGQKITFDDIEPPDNYDLQVFMEENEAIESVFKGCDEIFIDKLKLSPEDKASLENRLKSELDKDSYDVFIGKKQQKIEKYAVITDEKGCFHPITFITSVNSDGKIDNVAIMIYRESRGKEVTRTRFLHQYKGKSVESPISLNKDIIHITGATTSVRGINRGVRKTIAILDEFYLRNNRNASLLSYTQTVNQPERLLNNDTQAIFSQAYYAMGDIIEIQIAGTTEAAASKAFKGALDEVKRLDKIFNKDYKNSEVYLVNRKAGKKAVKCSNELIKVIRSSIRYSEMTNGNLDITEGTLAKRLQKRSKKPFKPEYIESLINASSYKNIVFNKTDDNGEEIFFKEKLTNIDTSLISKGYIVDMAIESLKKSKISHALVNFGGNIRVIGNPTDDAFWKIAIPDPLKNDKSLGYVKITNKAVSISGDYEKTIIDSRKQLASNNLALNALPGVHKIDIQKHFEANLLNAIVVAPTAFEADALSSAVILSGMNHNMELIKKIPDAEGIDLYKMSNGSLETEISEGMKDYFVQTVEPISSQRVKPACAL